MVTGRPVNVAVHYENVIKTVIRTRRSLFNFAFTMRFDKINNDESHNWKLRILIVRVLQITWLQINWRSLSHAFVTVFDILVNAARCKSDRAFFNFPSLFNIAEIRSSYLAHVGFRRKTKRRFNQQSRLGLRAETMTIKVFYDCCNISLSEFTIWCVAESPKRWRGRLKIWARRIRQSSRLSVKWSVDNVFLSMHLHMTSSGRRFLSEISKSFGTLCIIASRRALNENESFNKFRSIFDLESDARRVFGAFATGRKWSERKRKVVALSGRLMMNAGAEKIDFFFRSLCISFARPIHNLLESWHNSESYALQPPWTITRHNGGSGVGGESTK